MLYNITMADAEAVMKRATAYDLIVTNNYNDKLPSKEELIKTFFENKDFVNDETKQGTSNDNIIETKLGSSNVISIYKKGNEIRILRQASSPCFYSTKDGLIPIHPSGLERHIRIIEQSQKNWIDANKKELCPRLFFCGFSKVPDEQGRIAIHQTLIMEGYPMDLHDFYHSNILVVQSKRDKLFGANSITHYDRDIQKKLQKLLEEIAKLNLICVDIKPGNCVIQYDDWTKGKSKKSGQVLYRKKTDPNIVSSEPDFNIKIKLIDWDADYCHQLEIPPNQQSHIGILNNLIMANHFYTYFNFNIFCEYFQGLFKPEGAAAASTNDGLIKSLKDLFCEMYGDKWEGHYEENFESLTRHYMRLTGDTLSCEKLFDLMVARSTILSTDGDRFESRTIGGKKSKKKKSNKKNYKKKKSKKTKSRKTKKRSIRKK
jgi:hypothetical protein